MDNDYYLKRQQCAYLINYYRYDVNTGPKIISFRYFLYLNHGEK